MRRTDPRELLAPVLPAETYRRLGIAPPRPPQQFAPGGPVSAVGTPYVTGRAVTGAAPSSQAPSSPAPAHPAAPPPPSASRFTPPTAPSQPPRDRSVPIILGAAAVIVAIILGTTWYVLAQRDGGAASTAGDEQQIRAVIAAETAALNNRDLTALIATRCDADVRTLQREFTAQTFSFAIDVMLGSRGRWQVTVDSVAVDGDGATAQVTSTPVGAASPVAQTVTDTTTLRKGSGGWKVCEGGTI